MKRLIFLHLPKTAGQSCYKLLENCYEASRLCPARENYHLVGKSIHDLQNYDAFYGHLDWSLLDCVGHDAFSFTVLREPKQRIVSFYFFLRRAAQQLTDQELAFDHNRGLRAALLEPPDVFFCGGDPQIREFHDNLLDNLYTYYFAGRKLSARAEIKDVLARPDCPLKLTDIENCAVANLAKLSAVYRVSELDILQRDIEALGLKPRVPMVLKDTLVNEGPGSFETRMSDLAKLGATAKTFDRIEAMTESDTRIWMKEDLFRTH